MDPFKFFRNLNLGIKLNVVVVLTLGVLLTIIMAVTRTSIINLTTQTGRQRVEQEAGLVQSRFAEAVQVLLADTEFLADDPALAQALVDGDTAAINRIVMIGAVTFHMDDVDVVDATGARVVDIDKAASVEEDALLAFGLLAIENTGVVVEEGEGGELELRLAAAVPLFDASGEIAGALIASRAVDDEFLAKINLARTESVHLGIIYGGQILAQDHPDPEAGKLTYSLLLGETPAEHEQALSGQTGVVDHLVYPGAGVPHALAYAPLTVGGETRAAISVLVHYYEMGVFQRQLMINTAIIASVAALGVVGAILLFSRWSITVPIGKLRSVAQQMAAGDYLQRAETTTMDEVGQLSQAFNEMADQLQQTLTGLEQRVAERTRVIETSAEVSRRLSTILDPQQLAVEVVEQLQKAFNYYHAHIYIRDDASGALIMAGGTGDAGRTMLARGHRIPRGKGLVGRAAETQETVLIPDVSQEEGWLPNPLLPDTKAEIAVPIQAGGRVLGVLDVQQNVTGGLTQEDVNLLESIANQVSIVLQNARSFTEAQRRAEQEAQANLISQNIQRATTFESLIQTAARELGQTMGARRVSVQLAPHDAAE